MKRNEWLKFHGRLASGLSALVMVMATGGMIHADEDGIGGTGAQLLRLDIAARGAAMAGALTSSAVGYESLKYNPAGLGRSPGRCLEASYADLGVDVRLGALGYAHPVTANSAVGVELRYLDYGRTTRTTLADPTGASGATFSGQDWAVALGYGQTVNNSISLGITGKYFSSDIDRSNASAVMADVGIQWRPHERLRTGLAAQNLGTRLKYDQQNEQLPLLIRGGASYEVMPGRWTVNVEGELVRYGDLTLQVGTEYWIGRMLALRAGYDGRRNIDDKLKGLTAGLGARMEQFGLDYAFVPYGEIGSTHRISLRYDFGSSQP